MRVARVTDDGDKTMGNVAACAGTVQAVAGHARHCRIIENYFISNITQYVCITYDARTVYNNYITVPLSRLNGIILRVVLREQ